MLVQSFNLSLVAEKAQSVIVFALMECSYYDLAAKARLLNYAHYIGYGFLDCIKQGFVTLARLYPKQKAQLRQACKEALQMGRKYYPGLISEAKDE